MRSRPLVPPFIMAFAAVMLALAAIAQNKGDTKSPPQPAPSTQQSTAPGSIEKRVEQFLRNWYAWGSDIQLKVGPPRPAAASDLYEVPVEVTAEGGSDSAVVYVTKDGRYMFRGDLQDLNADPLAATRGKFHLDNYASKGPSDAKVVLVEFGDFECPSCRQLDIVLRSILPKYPQVRLVFKDFPLESIHPWAMTSAIAGHCALQQGSDTFWKFHDVVYDSQDVISPENAYNKLTDLAVEAGADKEKFQACMSDPKTQDSVRESVDEGRSLQVTSTPTTFVNGRRLIGPDQALLEQYLKFDLNLLSPK